MASLRVEVLSARRDNYIWLLEAPEKGGARVCIDPSDAPPVLDWLAGQAQAGKPGGLDEIWLTHHHDDHVGGVAEIVAATGCRVTGHGADAHRLPPLDRQVADGDGFTFAGRQVRVLFLPGHTLGHIAYVVEDAPPLLLCGDVLFSAGCGRLFEGSAAQMFASLARIRALPPQTRLLCAHEYTAANLAFAASVESGNSAIAERAAEVAALRGEGKPSLNSTLGDERRYNPFLRTDSPEIRRHLGMADATGEAVFAELRARKDGF